jgi:hypothetical protein
LLAREHNRITSIRRSFLHEVSSQLAKAHSGLALEELPVANLIRNKQQAAGSLMPLEGEALAIASAVVKPAPVNGEPTLRHPLGPRTPEKGGVRLPR